MPIQSVQELAGRLARNGTRTGVSESPEPYAANGGPASADSVELTAEILPGLSEVSRDEWNGLGGATSSPFTRYEFLRALEEQGCVGAEEGWMPQHLLLRAGKRLIGAVPMYAKSHSYGEFVFDWGWAEAYERAGLKYYPKLVVAAPYTPATGARLLCAERQPGDAYEPADLLVQAVRQVAEQAQVSSLHWLFTRPHESERLGRLGHLRRTGVQYHWSNPGYRDFQDFLDALTSKRRKQIRKERREAGQAPVEILVLEGSEIEDAQWDAYHALYASTYDRKWGFPSLTPGFFKQVGREMPEGVMLLLARRDGRYVAGAHLFKGDDALYGRNWGCSEFHQALHFEMCYYRCIEFCIERGLKRFEAGAQGEHKIMRGFLPVRTHSAHWLRHDAFKDAVGDFLRRERIENDRHFEYMNTHSPFRCTDAGTGTDQGGRE